jgi:hypothetical protein
MERTETIGVRVTPATKQQVKKLKDSFAPFKVSEADIIALAIEELFKSRGLTLDEQPEESDDKGRF